MKVKYIGYNTPIYTHGQIYEAKIQDHGYIVTAEAGQCWEPANRFEEVSLIEAKKKEISDAKINLEKLEKELAEMTLPRMGQRYLNETGNKYVVTKSNNMFALVCYEGDVKGLIYGGKFHDNVANIFCNCENCFTLIED
jgi:hypothetical protein